MKLAIVVACMVLTASCKEDKPSLDDGNWLIPECSTADASAEYVAAPGMKFGVIDGDKVCVSGQAERIRIEPSVRLLPKKSGINKVKFECDRESADLILRKHLGKRLYLFVKGKPFGEMRIGEIANEDWCSMSAPMEFNEALALCETIADGMGLDKDGCAKPCLGDEKVCAVVKESPNY